VVVVVVDDDVGGVFEDAFGCDCVFCDASDWIISDTINIYSSNILIIVTIAMAMAMR